MAVSAKIENDPNFTLFSDRANRALKEFAESIGLPVEELVDASSEEAIGNIIDRLVTIGCNAATKREKRESTA